MSTNDIRWAVFWAPELPATNDEAGMEAITTFVKAAGVQSVGTRGLSHAGIDVDDLETGFVKQVKGAATGVDTPLVFRDVTSDAGQAALETASNDPDGEGTIKLIKLASPGAAPATGDPVLFAQGILHSKQDREKSLTSHGGFSVTFRNNAAWVPGTQN